MNLFIILLEANGKGLLVTEQYVTTNGIICETYPSGGFEHQLEILNKWCT